MWNTTRKELEMPEEDYTFEEVWGIIEERYFDCFMKTKDRFKGVLTEEAPLQSACATIWINATKEKSAVNTYINQLKSRIAKINSEAIPSAIQVWEWHFNSFIQEFGGRIKGLLAHYVEQNLPAEQIERNIKERYYHLKCETLEDEDARKTLEVQLFGE